MQVVTPSMCPINEHLRSIYREIKGLIIMSIISLSNHYITTQHSHMVITDFHDLQLFLYPIN
jgi:hypothetical protein